MNHRNDYRYDKTGILSQGRIPIVLFCFLALAAFAVWAPSADAFPNASNCASCHSIGGQSSTFHQGHLNLGLPQSCLTCHVNQPGDNPVTSNCATCHVAQGLRQHHRNAGASTCASGCHTNPETAAPENTTVPGFATITAALDPCDGSEERFTSFTISLDNDGDLLYDGDDPDCQSVPPPNTPPVADDKVVATNQDTPVAVTLTGSDDDGDSLTYAVVAGPANGTLSGAAPNLTYTPNAGFSGSDSFTYNANDGTDASNTATVTITVNGDTTPPTGDLTGSPENGAINVPVTTVVTATGDDISTVVKPDTFTLMEGSSVAITTSLSESDDDDDHILCVTEGIVLGKITYNTINTVATFTPNCALKGSTIYRATITPSSDGQESVLAGDKVWSFTTIAMTPDSDDDGDPDDGDESPNDCRNATPGSSRGKGKIKIKLEDGHPNGCLKKIKATSENDPSVIPTGMPSGYEFRDGIIAYEIVGISTGETDTVTLTYPEAFPAGSKVYKVDSGGFHEYPDAVIDGNTVTLKVTDGGKGDMDGTADGKILDPVGVAVPAASGGGTIDLSTDAASGGCSVVGTGGGWKEAAGSYGLLALVLFGLALRRRKPESGR